jgi:hypothetical protein
MCKSHFPETKLYASVSDHLYMNIKSKRTRLIVEFKEVQPLPAWPIARFPVSDNSPENAREQSITLTGPARQTEFSDTNFPE